MSKDISVIIVNLNACQLLEECLASIYNHTREIAFEVIVVDNHSADASVRMVKTEFPQVCLIENVVNNRYALANNQGLAAASGKYVLYLNSDVRFLSNVCHELYQFLESHGAAGVVGGPLIYPDGRPQDSCFRFPSAVNLFYLLCCARFYWQTPLAGNYHFAPQQTAPQRVDFVVGACCLARRDALLQCRGMDPDFYLYGEDADLCYRLGQAGWQTYYLPHCGAAIHHGGASTRHLFGRDQRAKHLWGWKARLLFVKKHAPRWQKWLSILALVLGFGVNVLLYSAAGLKRRDWEYARHNLRWQWEITRAGLNLMN